MLNTGIVGTGVVSERHINSIQTNPRTRLKTICDLNEERGKAVARSNDAEFYKNYDEMVEKGDLDWIHICTPLQTHYQMSKTAITNGIPVLVQKPVTETKQQAEDLLKLSEEHQTRISVVCTRRFSSFIRELKEKSTKGVFGDLRCVDVRFAEHSWPDDSPRGNWVHDLDGGEFEEGLPHPIYLALNFSGYPESEDMINVSTSSYQEYDDYEYDGVQLGFVSKSGVQTTIKAIASEFPHRSIDLHFEQASAHIDLITETVIVDEINSESPVALVRKNLENSFTRAVSILKNAARFAQIKIEETRNTHSEESDRYAGHYYQINESAKAIENGTSQPVPMEEGVWTIALMEQISNKWE